jgi:hypothetical protein
MHLRVKRERSAEHFLSVTQSIRPALRLTRKASELGVKPVIRKNTTSGFFAARRHIASRLRRSH